jgi:hypothetical protein
MPEQHDAHESEMPEFESPSYDRFKEFCDTLHKDIPFCDSSLLTTELQSMVSAVGLPPIREGRVSAHSASSDYSFTVGNEGLSIDTLSENWLSKKATNSAKMIDENPYVDVFLTIEHIQDKEYKKLLNLVLEKAKELGGLRLHEDDFTKEQRKSLRDPLPRTYTIDSSIGRFIFRFVK